MVIIQYYYLLVQRLGGRQSGHVTLMQDHVLAL
jgi:hypothetical protein